ncbi:MAG: hypothetical protein RSF81_08410 [Oscillospiraceae bacterium]
MSVFYTRRFWAEKGLNIDGVTPLNKQTLIKSEEVSNEEFFVENIQSENEENKENKEMLIVSNEEVEQVKENFVSNESEIRRNKRR